MESERERGRGRDAHSLTLSHSLTRSLTPSIYLSHSHTRSLIHLLTRSLTHTLTHSLSHSPTQALAAERRGNNLKGFKFFLPESQGQNLALTLLVCQIRLKEFWVRRASSPRI